MFDRIQNKLDYYHQKVIKNRNNFQKTKIGKYLQRERVDGEELPQEKQDKGNPTRWKQISVLAGFFFIGLLIVANTIAWLRIQSLQPNYHFIQHDGLTPKLGLNIGSAIMNGINPLANRLPITAWFGLALLSYGISFAVSHKIGYAQKEIAYGQKGDSRLTTIKELQQQYKAIEDHDKPKRNKDFSFTGYGGIPISHYQDKYFIEDGAFNSIIVGQSRAGKGQMIVIPMIDIISRAQKKASMVINDPKLELYHASKDTLEKRGYEIHLLNLADGANSMSYNPLSLIIKAWELGDQDYAVQLINSFTYSLYSDNNAGQNKWANDGAQSAVNAMILALVRFCEDKNNFEDGKTHPEKIVLVNIVSMLTELGKIKYLTDPDNPASVVSLMDSFFYSSAQDDLVKQLYASTTFMPSKSKGSIYSTILDKLKTFIIPKLSRMTSMNSLALKDIGFPKYFTLALPKDLAGEIVRVQFRKKQDNKSMKYPLISEYQVRVGTGGFVEYNFEAKLSEGDFLQINYYDAKRKQAFHSFYKIHFPKIDLKMGEDKHVLELKEIINQIGIEKIKLNYSDKPIALFINTPDWDSSNDGLVSTFINQLYSELAKQCSLVAGNKTSLRVHFILDELGSLPAIKDMDHIMTISAGRNILITGILQSYEQLKDKYGSKRGTTIKDNGQIKILIKTDNAATNKEFSDSAGKRTIEDGSVHRNEMNISSGYNARADSVPVIAESTLSQMFEEDNLVLRPLHRRDIKGRRVRSYPIFNHGKTKMPYAYRLLSDEFEPTTDPNLIKIDSIHSNLDLKSLKIDYYKFLKDFVDDAGIQAYQDYLMQGGVSKEVKENTKQIKQNKELEKNKIKKEVLRTKTMNSKFIARIKELRDNEKIETEQFDSLRNAWEKADTKTFNVLSNKLTDIEESTLRVLWNKELKENNKD